MKEKDVILSEPVKHAVPVLQEITYDVSRASEGTRLAGLLTNTVKLNSDTSERDSIASLYRMLPAEQRNFEPSQLDTRIVLPDKEAKTVPTQILSVLLNGNIRRGNIALIQPYLPVLLNTIEHAVEQNRPVEIVLPTLAFKDQNPLTTRLPIGSIDLGEYLVLAQMKDIASSVQRVYEHGALVTLITDGLIYADIAGDGRREEIAQYRQNCIAARDQMDGLQGRVEIIDMEWLTTQEPKVSVVMEKIRGALIEEERKNEDLHMRLNALRRGMLRNISLPGYEYDATVSLMGKPIEDLPSDIGGRISDAALDYASILLALSELKIVQRAYPNALRGTVHPKDAAQLPLHLVNSHTVVFPYHGVPVVSEQKLHTTGSIRKATKIKRYYHLLEHEDAIAIYRKKDAESFYYSVN